MSRLLLLAALCFAPHSAVIAQGNSDLTTLQANLLKSYLVFSNTTGADADIDLYLSLLTPACTFSDLNYTYDPNTGFAPWTHMLRAAEMGSVYWTPECSHYKSAPLLTALQCVLSWELVNQEHSQNWWFDNIGEAQKREGKGFVGGNDTTYRMEALEGLSPQQARQVLTKYWPVGNTQSACAKYCSAVAQPNPYLPRV